MMPDRRLWLAFSIGWTATMVPAAPAGYVKTYVALGDSLTYGSTTQAETPVSYGDQGFVSLYADWLATQNDGVRPQVINLAIPGETSSSFFTGGKPGTAYNLNYSGAASQLAMLEQRIAAERAAGHLVDRISFALGLNDIGELITKPEFQNADFPTQQQLVIETLGAIGSNYTTVLNYLQTAAPEAELLLLGYYNPYAAVPGHPLYQYSFLVIGGLNYVINDRAQAYGARYVDVDTAFSGHEGEWTYMLAEPIGINGHPNALGYAGIAAAMIPEPTAGIIAAGAGVAMVAGRRRRRAYDRSCVNDASAGPPAGPNRWR